MLMTLTTSKIFFGSPMAQWTSKVYKVLLRKDLFEEDMTVFKTNSWKFLSR